MRTRWVPLPLLWVLLGSALGLACGAATVPLPGAEDAGTAAGPDTCPEDPLKSEPGMCGCGVADIDSDGDGMMDCHDGCPVDPEKFAAGRCGCGETDDADGDGVVDCDSGCADERREGFRHPDLVDLAACGGGFTVPGVRTDESRLPQCDRQAGDDGDNPSGEGCSVADLCAAGWHVCESAAEVAQRLPEGELCHPVPDEVEPQFFATRESGSGHLQCKPDGTDDLFGCGNVGDGANQQTCAPLERTGNNRCMRLGPPWSCGAIDDIGREALVVTKPGPSMGGVLCCRD